MLIEVAARNHLLRLKGYHPARELARMLGNRKPPRGERGAHEFPRAASLRREGEDGDV